MVRCRHFRAAWLIALAVLLLHLRLTWAGQGRQLAQDDEDQVEVSTADELKLAILSKKGNITFTKNITLTEKTFPEPPATCLQNNPSLEAFLECAPQTVVYRAENPEAKATWMAAPGVVLDAAYLFRGIILNRPLDLRDMTFAQIVDDLNPHFFLFGVLRGVSIAYRRCNLLSQCGGKGPIAGPQHMDTTLVSEFPLATRVVPNEQDTVNSFVYNALSKIPIPGAPSSANIQLLNNTRITCYSLPGPYERRSAPAIWTTGSASIAIRAGDTCQRPETLGADYRGTVNSTEDGSACDAWNAESPERTATADNLPEFGLGDHNFCRNPDRDEGGVWCYVNGVTNRQRCAVPNCTVEAALSIESGNVSRSSSSLSKGAFWGIVSSGIALVLAGLALMCYCCRNRLPCRDAPVKGEHDRVRMELENPRTDVTVDLGGSSAIDGPHSGIVMPSSKISAMHGEQPSPADRLEEELRKTMSDAGGESQLQWKEMIGSGAHGDVYRGVWKTLRVAIKSITFYGPAGSAALEDYATSALSCVHANIVKTLQCFRSALAEGPEGSRSEVLDLIHEHCEGGNLATALQSGFFLAPDRRVHNNNVMQVVWEMSVGLNYLHSKGAVHGDMNPRNVLLKGQKASAASPHMPCLAEASPNAAVRAHYESLCEGFVVKITDFGLGLTVRQTGAETASPPPGAQFYIAPEALEFGRYTEAADVFSFGVLLWELYHSQTPYKKTKPGFYIRPHIFPKFDEGASLPYAALTVACLHGDPSLRPTMDKVVMILQDMLMAGATASPPVTTVGVAKDGGTNVTELIRGTLGEDIESYRNAPAWRGVLEELNGITSSHILDLLTTNHLSDIINIPAPPKQPRNSRSIEGRQTSADAHQQGAARQMSGSASGAGGAMGAAIGSGDVRMQARGPRRSSGRSPAGAAAERAMGAGGTWEDNLLPGGDEEGSGDRQTVVVGSNGGIDRHAAALAAAGGDAAKITMLLHSIDRAPELGHARLHSVTSEEESEMFEDAKDELMSDDSFFIAQNAAGASASGQLRRIRPPWARGGAGTSMRRGAGRVSTDPPPGSVDASTPGLATSPRLLSNPISNTSVDGLAGRMAGGIHSGIHSGIMTPPVTGDLVSSRSNVSMVSDWDQYEMVKDEQTGKTRFNVQMPNFGGRVGGMKASHSRSHSQGRGGGEGLSHGHHLSSAALTSTTSGIDSNPGTPLASQTLDAAMAGELLTPMPPGSASTPGVSSILSTGGAAVAATAAAVAAEGTSPSPTPSGFGEGGVGAHSEVLQAQMLLAERGTGQGSTDGQRSTLEDGHTAADVDEEAAMDVLRWAPAQRAQHQAASAARRGAPGGGYDSNASPSQLTASHPTSGGSNSSLSSLSGVGAATGQGRVLQRLNTVAGQVQGLHSSGGVKSTDNAVESNMNASLSSIGARSSAAHTTLDRMPLLPSGPLSADQPSASVDARAANSSSAGFGRDSPINSGGRGTSRLASGPMSNDTGASVNVPPLHAGRAAATHLAHRPGLVSADSANAIAVPNIIVKGRAARSFDGMKLGEFRPMAMRSDRMRSYDGAQASGRGSGQPLSGSTRMSPGTSMRGQSEEGTSRGLMGLQSLFDSAENSDGGDGSDKDQVGLADVMQKGLHSGVVSEAGDHAPRSTGDATGAADGSTKEGKSKKDKASRSGSGAKGGSVAEKAARKAARRARKLQAAQARTGLDLEKLKKERGQASGSEGSPLSMRDLDVSHTSHVVSDTTSATPPVGSGEAAAAPSSAVEAASPGVSAASGAPVVTALASGSGASVASSTKDGVGIDLNPKHARPGAMGGRPVSGSGAHWRMSADVMARQHGSGRRNTAEMSKLQASGGSSKSGKAPVKAGLKQEATDAAGKSMNVRMYMHPLLRNNRAAIAHVEKIQLKGTDDTSGSGTRGSSLEHARTTSSGPQSSNARSSQARSHTSATNSGAADRVTM